MSASSMYQVTAGGWWVWLFGRGLGLQVERKWSGWRCEWTTIPLFHHHYLTPSHTLSYKHTITTNTTTNLSRPSSSSLVTISQSYKSVIVRLRSSSTCNYQNLHSLVRPTVSNGRSPQLILVVN